MMQTINSIIYTQYYKSPCGLLYLAEHAGRLCLCDWAEASVHYSQHRKQIEKILRAVTVEDSSPTLQKATEELDEYFRGKRQKFDIPLQPIGTHFQTDVWTALCNIPYGTTCSYKDLTISIGRNPHSVRPVAQAIGANKLSIFIPCHRVIGSNNSLTGFAGGLETKRFLLQMEHIQGNK